MTEKTFDLSLGDFCAVLLRGGKSRRMGRDKASLPWEGNTTFLEAVARQMDFLQEKYLSVAAEQAKADPLTICAAEEKKQIPGLSRREDRFRLKGWTVLPDRAADCGPMGGIWTALTACRAKWALVVSCDIPAVHRTLLYRLLQETASGQYEIIYPKTPDGRIHLTCAVYKKSIAPCLEQQILKGDYRLRELLLRCACREVAVTDPAQVLMLSNINTKEDLEKVKGQKNRQKNGVFPDCKTAD